uniref:PARP catalytic domain-containing protein n=1 Tax=Neolamprologus brichardi TaxID=32507 RepID=A0A3Q4GRA7_NEOBR
TCCWWRKGVCVPCLETCVVPLSPTTPTYIMYHGTTRACARSILASGFCQSPDGMLGRGVYLTRDLKKASRYPIDHPDYDKIVIKVKVRVGKVKIIDHQDHPLRKCWYYHGYDTAWVPPYCGMVQSGQEEDCVWDPNRIKIISTIKIERTTRYTVHEEIFY